MRIPIVNEQDETIGYKDDDERILGDIFRVSALWIKNSKGEVLLTQRAFRKRTKPGCWGPAVAGMVEETETYESNIIKESKEEINYTLKNFILGPKIKIESGIDKYFVQIFINEIDLNIDSFVFDKHEVEQVKWFSKSEVQELLEDREKVTSDLYAYSELFLSL